jgi:hypothetical protein
LAEAGADPNDPTMGVIILPCEASPRFLLGDFIFDLDRDVECKIVWQSKEEFTAKPNSSQRLPSLDTQLRQASTRVANEQIYLHRLKERYAALQRDAVGDTREAELFELQLRIRNASDRVAIAQRDLSSVEFQISQIVDVPKENFSEPVAPSIPAPPSAPLPQESISPMRLPPAPAPPSPKPPMPGPPTGRREL